MMLRFAVLAAFTLLGFFVFPGHTYLQSDTHIYLPMMERIANPALLGNDIIATHPHLRYTVYDEIAGGLKQLTGGDFEPILAGLQLGARFVGLYGVYLLATAAGLEAGAGLFLAGLFGLGALIIGPAVLTVEYEPIPRGMAIPLLLLAMGLAGHGRWRGTGIALGAAFLLHPPTVWPVWLVLGGYALWRGRGAIGGMVGGVLALWLASRFQVGETERQAFWATVPPDLEALQRMRASYVWVGMWQGIWWVHHAVLLAVAVGAWWRIRGSLNDAMRVMLLGLPILGALSAGLSYLLLDLGKWIVVPQVQPARALLWVTMGAVLNGGIAAARAARAGFMASRRASRSGTFRRSTPWCAGTFCIAAPSRSPSMSSMSLRRRSAPGRSDLFTAKTSAISMTPAFSVWIESPDSGTSTTSVVSAALEISSSLCPTPTVSSRMTSIPNPSSTSHTSRVDVASPPNDPRVAIDRIKTPGSSATSSMRIRSPRSAPPVNGDVGSTATMPTRSPALR